MTGARRWAIENWTLLVAGAVAALPVILSTAHTIASGWTPVGDDAMIAVRSYDVFTTHTPLVGQYSTASEVLGHAAHSPGPMLYWLLAIPSRFGGAPAMTVTMGLVNSAAMFGAIALARRRGGLALMIVAAAALAVMSGSLVGHTYSDIWTPAAGLLPFTFLIFLAWSVGCGDHRLLPLAALVASFVVQCHLTYLLPSAGLLVVAIAGLVAGKRSLTPGHRQPLRRWIVATLAVLLVCWIGPLVDLAIHRPANLEVLARTALAGEPTLGADDGARAVVQAVGVPPWWLRTAHSPSERLVDVIRGSDTLGAVSSVLVLAGLFVVLVMALRRRRRDVAVAGAQALALCLALGLVAAATPTQGLLPLSLGYTLWWGSATGAWAWLTLVCGAAVLLIAGRRLQRLGTPAALGALAAAGTAAVVVTLATAGPGQDPLMSRYAPMRSLASRLEHAVPRGRTVLVASSPGSGFDTRFDYGMGAVYALRRSGRSVVSGASAGLGSAYRPTGRTVDYVLRVERAPSALPAGARVLDRLPPGPGIPRGLLVTLAPR